MRSREEPLRCIKCGNQIGPNETVYRTRIRTEEGGSVGIEPRCAGCLEDAVPPSRRTVFVRWWWMRTGGGGTPWEDPGLSYPDFLRQLGERRPEACEACGRPVVALDGRAIREKGRAACDARCRREVELWERRERRVEARAKLDGGKRRCESCGRRFKPGRSDQVYCRNACRQSAYRERRSASRAVGRAD